MRKILFNVFCDSNSKPTVTSPHRFVDYGFEDSSSAVTAVAILFSETKSDRRCFSKSRKDPQTENNWKNTLLTAINALRLSP